MTTAAWRLAASTLGAPGEDLESVITTLHRHGAEAVELRAAEDAVVSTAMSPEERDQVRSRLAEASIEVLSVASGVWVMAELPDEEVVGSMATHIRLAADLGATFLRLFPGAPAEPAARNERPTLRITTEEADARAVRRLDAVIGLALQSGVRPVLETHDSHPRGEQPARTSDALLPYLTDGCGYAQIKDVANPSDTTPVLQGSGAVPVPEILDLLAAAATPVQCRWSGSASGTRTSNRWTRRSGRRCRRRGVECRERGDQLLVKISRAWFAATAADE